MHYILNLHVIFSVFVPEQVELMNGTALDRFIHIKVSS